MNETSQQICLCGIPLSNSIKNREFCIYCGKGVMWTQGTGENDI